MNDVKYAEILEHSRYKARCKKVKSWCPKCRTAWAYPEYTNNKCLVCGETLTSMLVLNSAV